MIMDEEIWWSRIDEVDVVCITDKRSDVVFGKVYTSCLLSNKASLKVYPKGLIQRQYYYLDRNEYMTIEEYRKYQINKVLG